MGKALFTLFAVFGPLFGQGAGEPYFAGRGGPFLHAPARTNYTSPPKVRAWRALLKGLQGAVFNHAVTASGEWRVTLHAISHVGENSAPMGKPVFTLIAPCTRPLARARSLARAFRKGRNCRVWPGTGG